MGGQRQRMRTRNHQMPQTTLDLPENLGARCSLLYVWDEEYTLRALEGYLQFMELKANFEDWDAEQLAPSGVIDLVWQQHLLYNKQYAKACLTYCENIIGYDPDVALVADLTMQEQRIKTTKIALKALYGRGYDKDIWNFQGGTADMQKKGGAKVSFNATASTDVSDTETVAKEKKKSVAIQPPVSSSAGRYDSREDDHHDPQGALSRDGTISDSDASELRIGSSSSHPGPPPSSTNRSAKPIASKAAAAGGGAGNNTGAAESVTMKIKCFIDGKTQDTCIRVKRTTKMKKVEECLARLMNLASSDSLRFLVDGEQVSPWETLESMKVEDPEQHWFTVMPKVGYQ